MSGTWWKDPADLIEEQLDILDLPLDQSLLIKGPPGSGKTNLLLLRANYMYIADMPNINVAVMGSVLRNFIQLGGGQYKFPPEKVVTHSKLFSNVLAENGINLDVSSESFEGARARRLSAISALRQSGKVGKIFQALLLDEAQDYFPEELRLLGEMADTIVAASDVKQKIYDGPDVNDVLEALVDDCYELQYHFRNGREICRVADAVMKGQIGYTSMLTHSQYDEREYKSSVTVRGGIDLEAQAQAIIEQLKDQRLAYPEDVLGVLCPRNEDVAAIQQELLKSPLADEVTRCKEAGFNPGCHVWLSTIASAKGLEFRAVHLAGLDSLSATGRGAQRRLAFTAITRAKTALSMYYEKQIPGYLDSAMRVVNPLNKSVTKDMIFGKV